MPRHEHEVAVGHAVVGPRQMVLHPGRPSMLVGAEEADVEVEPGKLEVVGVAAKEGDLLLRREDQPHVGVLLRAVEVVGASLIERDHVTPQSGRRQRLLFDLGHRRPAGGEGRFSRHPGDHRRLNAVGHVLD